ncbi:EndoU domain-containing protein [Paenibacillus melissococcoides]|uniref:EndoU domain-containing protein n=1 Tax=Paenibacillus melissococcoides TaxID=2912268 RepID=A0ABN8U0U0_9BACL|nr:EndoU domain-containing protein [Paenibacillus melissococcoides]CAH8244590.1 EndoU domain-containing protein [Paenibacillus melissococcoides]CAH8708431.1 EndoU domain-containing protein [Paenibacillus melissococcoides]CAH8709143.1 EndoU domain-containing protein [Paenibacillus melissococcoides]
MSTSTKLAGYGNIQIVSPYEVHSLSTLRVEKKVNEHARMLLTAIIPEEKKDSCVAMANDTDKIEIRELSDEGDVIRTLFHGVLSDIAVKVVRGVYHLEMEAVSHSYRLDIKPKTRSFQNHKMPYEELVQHILSDYPGSDFIDLTFNNAPLDQFTVQYEETDWQFLKRMVSRFGTVLIPEAAADSPKLWVGLPEGKPDSLRNTNYQVLRTLNNYGQKEEGVTSYLIVTKRYYNLGDRILFKNKPLIVTGSTSLLHEGMLTRQYTLQAEADRRWRPIWNESIRGASLAGKVIDAAKDKVKLHLNIDDVQTKEEACWFPYSSPYVAGGKTGLYSMPQIGDSVQLYIPNHREEEAFVRSSFREGGNSPKLSNPSVKYWGNPFGKELKFNGNELRMTAQENHVFMKLHDNEGIELHSKDAIVLHADREIALEAGRLDIRAKEAVYLLSGSSSIVLDGDTDIKAGQVTVKGLTKSPVRVEQPDSPAGKGSAQNGKPLKSSTELALHALAMIPGIGNAAVLGAKTIAATGGNTSHLPSNKTGKSNSVADYSKAAYSMMASIPSPLPTTPIISINNPKDVSELISITKAMQLSKVFTSARGLPNQLPAEDLVEKLKLSMKLRAIAEKGRENLAGSSVMGPLSNSNWQSEPAKKDFLDEYLVDPLVEFFTGEKPGVKTQGQKALEAQLITMQMQQQMVLTELSSDFQAAMRGAASADRIAEVTSIGTPKINNGKSTIGQVQKMQSRVGGTGEAYRTVISDEMKEKILLGQRKDPAKNELIGGHSPEITNSHPHYAVEKVSINADGTKKVKFTTQFSDGNLSKIKTSTLFPESWSDEKIIDSIAKIGDTPKIGQRARDGATLHRGIVDGVQVEVIKIGDNVVSGYPTGGGATSLLSGFQ